MTFGNDLPNNETSFRHRTIDDRGKYYPLGKGANTIVFTFSY